MNVVRSLLFFFTDSSCWKNVAKSFIYQPSFVCIVSSQELREEEKQRQVMWKIYVIVIAELKRFS